MSLGFATSLLRCPRCRGSLSSDAGLECTACQRRYQVIDGIPILVPDVAMIEHDEVGHHHRDGHPRDSRSHKAEQAGHFDQALAEEFEITRPHGTPRLYEFLIREKLRRALAPIGPGLVGATALTVCGGSGMDAEFLAEAGCQVVSSDISLGAARRTQERARRYGVDITAIVADVEHLPIADEAFDLVLVHDGLHHLEHPEAGLVEIARVAHRWVSISEPARAAATAVAVRTGIALEREEAGNVVARMMPGEVLEYLSTVGFHPLRAERYAMYYRHEPGVVFRMLSHRLIFPFVRWGWRLGNAVLGRVGNKMVVVAARGF
jgi:SAM-dependent methyltransferase/uncharacterized protein YbaR (Trm112 family)